MISQDYEALSPVPAKLLKVPKPPKKITYSSSSKNATGKQNSGSGKNVSFANIDQSASGDDEGIEESDDDQYVPSNTSKKRSHEEIEKERRVPRNAPLRRSVSLRPDLSHYLMNNAYAS